MQLQRTANSAITVCLSSGDGPIARRDTDPIVIDEVGRMECASGGFCRAVEEALKAQVGVFGTLGIAHPPFLQSVRMRPGVELLALTEPNRNTLVPELCFRLHKLGTCPERQVGFLM
jgi:nucleoside-triphosphatase THEP1